MGSMRMRLLVLIFLMTLLTACGGKVDRFEFGQNTDYTLNLK